MSRLVFPSTFTYGLFNLNLWSLIVSILTVKFKGSLYLKSRRKCKRRFNICLKCSKTSPYKYVFFSCSLTGDCTFSLGLEVETTSPQILFWFGLRSMTDEVRIMNLRKRCNNYNRESLLFLDTTIKWGPWRFGDEEELFNVRRDETETDVRIYCVPDTIILGRHYSRVPVSMGSGTKVWVTEQKKLKFL